MQSALRPYSDFISENKVVLDEAAGDISRIRKTMASLRDRVSKL